MRILITGCHGQVGSSLTEQLASHENTEVLALDREHLDITNQDVVNAAVAEFKPSIIINAAAHTAVDRAEEEVDLSYAINRDGPKYLAQAAQSVGAAILHISTDYVFEGNKAGEYVEADATNPQGVYGESKLAGEIAVAQACDKHIILRTAWVFGEQGNNFVKTMLRLGKDREALSIVGDQYGGPTYAGDIAKALIAVMNKLSADNDSSLYGVYHFSGAPYVSWYEFAQEILQEAETKQLLIAPKLSSITTDMYPTPAVRPENSKMNCDKIANNFGIAPSNWQAALENIEGYMA